jgi:hypothetical protein
MKEEDKEGALVCIMIEITMTTMTFCIVLVSLHTEFSAGLNPLKLCQVQIYFDDI